MEGNGSMTCRMVEVKAFTCVMPHSCGLRIGSAGATMVAPSFVWPCFALREKQFSCDNVVASLLPTLLQEYTTTLMVIITTVSGRTGFGMALGLCSTPMEASTRAIFSTTSGMVLAYMTIRTVTILRGCGSMM